MSCGLGPFPESEGAVSRSSQVPSGGGTCLVEKAASAPHPRGLGEEQAEELGPGLACQGRATRGGGPSLGSHAHPEGDLLDKGDW